MEALGLDQFQLDQAIHVWTGFPTEAIKKAAPQVIRARVRDPLAKLLAVEREVALKTLGFGKKVTLYRGIKGDYASKVKKELADKGESKVVLWGAQSWTDDLEIARVFSRGSFNTGVILKIEIPTRYVIACHKSNARLARYGEKEYIVSIPGNILKVTKDNVIFP